MRLEGDREQEASMIRVMLLKVVLEKGSMVTDDMTMEKGDKDTEAMLITATQALSGREQARQELANEVRLCELKMPKASDRKTVDPDQTSQPALSQPAHKSASPQPASPHPASPQPASPQPASPHPACPQPASPQPASPQPASPHPARNTVEVRGLLKETMRETVEYYFQNSLSSGGGKIRHFLWDKTTGLCLLSFKSSTVAQCVASRKHRLDGKKLAVKLRASQSRPTKPAEKKAVCVENFDIPTTTEDALRNHFENPRNGGGEVTDVKIGTDRQNVLVAIVTFREAKAAQNAVTDRTHQLNGYTLIVTLHTPAPEYPNVVSLHGVDTDLSAEDVGNFSALSSHPLREKWLSMQPVAVTSTVEVHLLPRTPSLCQETLTHYFQNKTRSDVSRVQFLPGMETALVTFDDPEVCSNVASQPHEFHNSVLDVRLHFECVGLCGPGPPSPSPDPPPENREGTNILQRLFSTRWF
ncbi:hypothetical protein ACOMHN_015273 [Nucella lapillus]